MNRQIVIARAYATLYGGFLYPRSDGLDVYFTVSQFAGYNVSLMRLQLPGNFIATALDHTMRSWPACLEAGVSRVLRTPEGFTP